MSLFTNIGFGNIVNSSRIVAMVSPESAPMKRMVQNAKESGMIVDATQGRKTKSVLVMDSGHVVLSALLPETLAGRVAAPSEDDMEEPESELEE